MSAVLVKLLFLFALMCCPHATLCDIVNVDHQYNDQISEMRDQIQNLVEITEHLRREITRLDSNCNKSANLPSKPTAYISRSCYELIKSDPTLEDGNYYIDPDGWNTGDPPIYVHCSKTGHTNVLHDTQEKMNVSHCFDPGCYTRAVNYNATMRQMKALIELSPVCEQFIRYDCFGAVFAFGDTQYAWWNDRNGGLQYYWAQDNDTVHTCSCGINGSCIDPSQFCNCDASAAIPLFDEGYITNKSHLPITRLNFGRTSPSYTSGEHTLGPLRCYGSYQSQGTSIVPASCADLWRSGTTTSGLYLVKPTSSNAVNTVFCDMNKLPGETGQEIFIGVTDVKSSLVHFAVTRKTPFHGSSTSHVRIPYEVALLNIGNAMNITTGIFTAPIKGVYSFGFNFRTNAETSTGIYLNRNGGLVTYAASNEATSSGLQSILSLEVGDVVEVRCWGDLWEYEDGTHHATHFTGSLLQAL